MSGTRPYSPGFGSYPSLVGGTVMQKQPEPCDGKPRIPDASSRKFHSPHHSKRGKTRFRDDKSKKHYHGTNSNRFNVKKFDGRKDSPSKSFQGVGHNKKDKLKHKNDVIEKIPVSILSTECKSPLDKNMPIIELQNSKVVESRKNLFIEQIQNESDTKPCNAENLLSSVEKPELPVLNKDFHTDTDMKLVDENVVLGNDKKDVANLKENYINEQPDFEDVTEFPVNIEELNTTLKEYLLVETKFQPKLYFPTMPQRGDITAGTRDGAVHVLRCLKVWYDMPPDVLFHAINLFDRFLTKMKVRLCHISCISVSCMHIAISSHQPKLTPINAEDLVSISQCKCTAGDVRRMSVIIEQKLGVIGDSISSLHWLRLFLKLLRWATVNVLGLPSNFLSEFLKESEVINRLEILSCDASCCSVRACELALVLICTQLDSHLNLLQRSNQYPEKVTHLMKVIEFAMELQRACQIGDESFYITHQAVLGVLERYNTRQKTPHRQCLVWKLSSRTLKVLRPTDKLTSMLPTIEEQQFSSGSPLKKSVISRSRCGSESSDDLNEDTKDWPTSPVVPVLCNNN